MGMIADELERSILQLQPIMAVRNPFTVQGTSFHSPSGQVAGFATIDTTLLYQQLEELTKAVGKLSKAIRKLEDTKKP